MVHTAPKQLPHLQPKRLSISVKTIMDDAGWANAGTFSQFYDKPNRASVSDNFGVALLKTSVHHNKQESASDLY